MKEGIKMALKDIFSKGMDMINKGVASAKDAAQEKRQAMQEFDFLKTRSNHIGPMNPYQEQNPDPQLGKEQMILNACLTINVENSKIVNKLIPIDETILDVKTGKEAKTEIEYAFIATDKKLWVMNKNEYITYEYDTIKNFEIINKGIMSQGVKFNDNAFTIDGKDVDVETLGRLLMDKAFREESIARRTSYLCGVVPKKQFINMNLKGITIGENGDIALHNTPDNKLINIKDVASIQLLVNNTSCLMRGQNDSGNIMNNPMEARCMSVKFILTNGEYTIDYMPQSMMNTTYKREDATYIKNYDFGKAIVEEIASLLKNVTSTSMPEANSQNVDLPLPNQETPTPNSNQATTPVPNTNMPNPNQVFGAPMGSPVAPNLASTPETPASTGPIPSQESSQAPQDQSVQ